jgi:hypothetical protein
MPKVLINAQKEQICRSQGPPGYREIIVIGLEFLRNATKLITTLILVHKGKIEGWVGGT